MVGVKSSIDNLPKYEGRRATIYEETKETKLAKLKEDDL
jgi:hypothetical protein